MSQDKEMQKFIRFYKQETGETQIDMHDVARFALSKGWTPPKPKSSEDLLAAKFSKAARQEMRTDKFTGRPYRANHAVPSGQMIFWIDIDEAPRKHMVKSSQMRREQMVGDALQLTFDIDHWNAMNPSENPIEVELDLTFDVELRKASEESDDAA